METSPPDPEPSEPRPIRPAESARRIPSRERPRGFDGGLAERQESVARALSALRTLERVHALPPALQPLLHLAPPERHEAVVSWAERGVWIGMRPLDSERPQHASAESVEIAHVQEVVRLVDRSERDGRLPFLALTFFRDRLLPRWGGSWTAWDRESQLAVESALQRGWLRGIQVPNPRNPAHPTTAIELEREHADVRALLAEAGPEPTESDTPAEAPAETPAQAH